MLSPKSTKESVIENRNIKKFFKFSSLAKFANPRINEVFYAKNSKFFETLFNESPLLECLYNSNKFSFLVAVSLWHKYGTILGLSKQIFQKLS